MWFPKIRFLSLIMSEPALKNIFKAATELALAMANLCLRKIAAICSTVIAAQSLLFLIQRSYVSVRKLCQWIFAHFLLPLPSLMHMRRSKLNLKISPASVAPVVPNSTENPVLHADCSFSLDSAHAAESSLLPSLRLKVRRRLAELTGPIRTKPAPVTIRLSSSKDAATQKGCRQLKCRSDVIRSSCASELKKHDQVSAQMDVSTKPGMHHLFRSSSFRVNSRSQTIDPHDTKQRNRNTSTSVNVMQTKGLKANESKTYSKLAMNEHAVIGGSSLLVVLSTLSLGQFPAIVFTCMSWIAILYIKGYHERGRNKGLSGLSVSSKSCSQEINKSSISATVHQIDFTSDKYKKRVIMEGLLERSHGIY